MDSINNMFQEEKMSVESGSVISNDSTTSTSDKHINTRKFDSNKRKHELNNFMIQEEDDEQSNCS